MSYTGKINFVRGELQGSSIDLQPGKQQVLGRNGANCNIFFQSDRVSRVHCAISFNESTGRLTLLNYSTSGTTVNGRELGPQQTVELDNGAKVRLGHSDNEFTFTAQQQNTTVNVPKKSGIISKLRRNYAARADRGATIFEDFWVDDDEKEIATLGNDRVLNYFTGNGILKNRAVLTNKRLYINEHHGILSYSYKRYIVEVDEITSTSIMKRNPIWSLVMAGLWLILGIVMAAVLNIFAMFLVGFAIALGQVFAYLKMWGSWFVVYFPGGWLQFSLKNYSLYQTVEFQRAISALKSQEKRYADS